MVENVINLDNAGLSLPSRNIKNRSGKLNFFLDFFRGGDTIHKAAYEKILINISLSVKKGETLGILGRNGSGKTTLLKLMSGIVSPTSGKIKTSGKILPMLTIGSFLSPMDSAYNNLYLLSGIYGVPVKERDLFVKKVLDFTELSSVEKKPISMFSRGMQSKLLVVFYYFLNADIYIIDEIMGAGDEKFNAKFVKFMESKLSSGSVFILATHNYSLMRQFCNRAIVLDSGSVIFDGSIEKALNVYRLIKG
jgi:lipopolysaccharide transport system ATP-binding protein